MRAPVHGLPQPIMAGMKPVIVGEAGCLTDSQGAALPGALEAVAHLNQAGFTVLVATDIPELAGSGTTMATVSARHAQLQQALGAVGGRIDALFFCSAAPGTFPATFAALLRDIGARYDQPLAEMHAIFASADECGAAAEAGLIVHRLGIEPSGTAPGEQLACPDLAACARALVAALDAAAPSSSGRRAGALLP